MANASSARVPARVGMSAVGAGARLVLGASVLCAACPPASSPCASDQDCGRGTLCVASVCRTACNSDLDCTGRERCADGVCMPEPDAADATRPDAADADTAPADAAPLDTSAAEQQPGDATPGDGDPGVDAAAGMDRAAEDAAAVEDTAASDGASAEDSQTIADAAGADAAAGVDGAVDASVGDLTVIDAPAADLLGVDHPPTEAGGVDGNSGDAATADGAAGDGGSGGALCGTVELMADDFEDGVVDWRWHDWAMVGTRVSETQGHLAIALAEDSSSSAYAGYNSGQHTSLLGRTLVVELVQGVNTAGAAQASLIFRRDLDNQLTITQTGNTLRANHTVDGGGSSSAVAYSSELHRWLRLREDSGRVHFETSRDGQTWASLHSDTTPGFASSGRVILEAGTYKDEPAPGVAIFDNLGLRASEVDWCPLSTLQDDFDGPGLGLAWEPESVSGCAIHLEAQALVLEASERALCAMPSASVYRLQGSGVSVEVARTPLEDQQADVGVALWSPVDMTDLELSAFASGRIAVWDSVAANYEEFTVVDPRALAIHQDAAGVHWEVLDGDGIRHRLYSTAASTVRGPFFAILWLDCTECNTDSPGPVRAILDRVNVY